MIKSGGTTGRSGPTKEKTCCEMDQVIRGVGGKITVRFSGKKNEQTARNGRRDEVLTASSLREAGHARTVGELKDPRGGKPERYRNTGSEATYVVGHPTVVRKAAVTAQGRECAEWQIDESGSMGSFGSTHVPMDFTTKRSRAVVAE